MGRSEDREARKEEPFLSRQEVAAQPGGGAEFFASQHPPTPPHSPPQLWAKYQ